MLQLTPQLLATLRAAQTLADEKVRGQSKRENELRKLNSDRARRMIAETADILRDGLPTKFAYEGATRHGIRQSLVLQGWNWGHADTASASVVNAALKQVGAERPTYDQGQPGYTEEGFAPVQRTRCMNCHGKLPEGDAQKFCSTHCNAVHHNRLSRQFEVKQSRAEWRASVAAKAKHRKSELERDCDHCQKPFTPDHHYKVRQFCSIQCSDAAKRVRPDRPCVQCGTMFHPRKDGSRCCSLSCAGKFKCKAQRRPAQSCVTCTTPFQPRRATSQYCSPHCHDVARMKRRPDPRQCGSCGTYFQPRRPNSTSKYCSRICSGSGARMSRLGLRCEAAE